jgi:glycopeptide antibiotics resistance protein
MRDDYPPKSRVRVVLGTTLLLLYGAVVLLATMWPTPLDQGYAESIDRVLGVLHRNGIPEWFGYSKLEFSANIAMFVPIGFLVALLLPWRAWWLVFLLVPAFSVGIEALQGAMLAERFSSPMDVLANSLGGIAGGVFAALVRQSVYHRDRIVIARALHEVRWSRTDGGPTARRD